MSTEMEALRRTALFEAHRALGARIVPFAGFEMPVQYAGILKEHYAVRNRAGLFDLSHMAQFGFWGPNVGAWADALCVNHVATMKPLQARYNIFCNAQGGAHDDVIWYRLDDDRWLLVVNGANAEKMWNVVSAHPAAGVKMTNMHGERALIAVQGPRAVAIVGELLPDAAPASMKYYSCRETRFGDKPIVLARTGYTGEDGFELMVESRDALAIWDAVLDAGRPHGLEPCGLGARDMLRLEAGMPLYGQEMTEEIGPLQAGLGWAVKFDKPEFVGREALLAQSEANTFDRIVGLTMEGKVPARSHYPVHFNGAVVGDVRSATLAPSYGGKQIATALVPVAAAEAGTTIDVEIRGTAYPATVTAMPFYKRPK
jgi:aminomethyltransferase